MGDKFLVPSVIGVFLIRYGWSKCCIGLYVSQTYKGGLPCNFFHSFFYTNKVWIHGDDENWPWQKILIFWFFFVFLRKFPKIFNWRFSALYCWQNKLRWALGSNFLKNIVLTEFQMIHFEKIWLWIKRFLPFRISCWLRD